MATLKQLAALKKARAAKAKKVPVKAKSKATGKAPSKRLQQRRAKNLTGPKGYYPNPIKSIIEVVLKNNKKCYLTSSGGLDDDFRMAHAFNDSLAVKKATDFFNKNMQHLKTVSVVKEKKQ